MTIYGLIASLAWTATAVLCIARAREFALRWLALVERKAPVSPQPEPPIVIPNDLMALAMGETEKWAQDSVVDAIRDRWSVLKDWNKVRSAMGIGSVST